MHRICSLTRPDGLLRRQGLRAVLGSALAGLALAFPAAQAADKLDLRFVQPEQFFDIGFGHFERERHLRTLREHLERLAQTLPEGQSLQLEVLDVDLAGRIEPHMPYELRVLRGNVDWPHISLRYTLKAGDTTLSQGEDQLSDPSYLFTRRRAIEHQPLAYERRMLDTWFRERFTPQQAAAAR